ncbi:MAG: hypothetical protein ABIH28_01615 [archaeon]
MKKKEKKRKILKKSIQATPSRKDENPVYVQLTSEEFSTSKKDILSYQMALINMIKSIKKYNLLRDEEVAIKINLQNTLKETNENIRKIETRIPKIEEHKHKQKSLPEKKPSIEYYDQNLESQLEQIRRKLEEIGR